MVKKKQKSNKRKVKSAVFSAPDKWTAKSREEQAKQFFNRLSKRLQPEKTQDPEYYESLDLASVFVKRRIKAIVSLAEEVKERYKEICPDIEEVFSIDKVWIALNAFPVSAYDHEEQWYYFAFSAAIWMLDHIRDNGKLEDLIDLLPMPGSYGRANVPKIYDTCHSEQLLHCVTGLIQHRNDESEEDRLEPADPDEMLPRYFVTNTTATGKINGDSPTRKAYDAIIELIDQEAITGVKRAFCEKYWDWLDRFFKSYAVLMRQKSKLRTEVIRLSNKNHVFNTEMEERRENAAKQIKQGNILALMPPVYANQNAMKTVPGYEDMIQRIYQLKAEERTLDAKISEIESLEDSLVGEAGTFSVHTRSYVEEKYGAEIADIWDDFELSDPYVICFALLMLIDEGSDLPWCYYPGTNLMRCCSAALPWAVDRDSYCDQYWNDDEPIDIRDYYDDNAEFDDDDEINDEINRMLNEPVMRENDPMPKRIKVPELEDWYKLQYEDKEEEQDEKQRYNLAQIMYEATGCIMPRKPERYIHALEILDRYGINGKKVSHPLMYCISLLGEAKHQSGSWYDFLQKFASKQAAAIESNLEDEASPEELKKQIAELKSEMKQLKQSAYEANKELQHEKEKYEELEYKVANELQELADLRELAFNRQEGFHEDETPEENISFPYRTTRRIIAFGGHDSWAREIKPKLPDVRFVDKDAWPNADTIRRADVVWIQTNAMSHSYFYMIMNETRKYDVPVRYFTYASAVKCAEQVAMVEEELKS